MSPLALRRKYLPRNTTQPPAAHRAAAPAAKTPQAEPHPAPHSPEKTAKIFESTNRSPRVKRFKPGFETQTELELAIAFKRPPRTYATDTPFYPWLPITPKVQFNLNYPI
nr:MAG: hypothetical protein [Gammatorquevirus sp.]